MHAEYDVTFITLATQDSLQRKHLGDKKMFRGQVD